MSAIKLYKIDELEDGTQRFQSQLALGKDSATHVMQKDNIMKAYGHRKKGGFDFYPMEEPYEIVSTIKDMELQTLL